LLWGVNTCDQPLFAQVAERRGDAAPPRRFLFVGRLVPDKGVDVLAAAYRAYRAAAEDPWPLLVRGVGPRADELAGLEGVEMLGFVQPPDLPAVFERAGCLVLPSRHEPWAGVVHAAGSARPPGVRPRRGGAPT